MGEPTDIPRGNSASTRNRRVCVIGGGAAGLAALKILKETEEEDGWTLTAYEARDNVGGVWLSAPPNEDPPYTPLYDSLTTNLPHPVMAYSSLQFPPSTPLFPRAKVVEEYLRGYADHFNISKSVRCGWRVVRVQWIAESNVWKVRVRKENGLEEENHDYDYVVVANGHYRIPRFPGTLGLDTWRAEGKALHSAYYRHPLDEWKGQKVMVVGGGPSGVDLSREAAEVASIVIWSTTGRAEGQSKIQDSKDWADEGKEGDGQGGGGGLGGRHALPVDDLAETRKYGKVKEYGDIDSGRVIFEDGTVEEGINFVLCATGYEVSCPFLEPESSSGDHQTDVPPVLEKGLPPPPPPLPEEAYNSTYHIFPLARHLFPLQARYPSTRIAFLGLLVRVVPFPLIEAQMRLVRSIWRNPSLLDQKSETTDIIERFSILYQQAVEHGIVGEEDLGRAVAKGYPRFSGNEQFDYRDAACKIAGSDWRVRPWEIEFNLKAPILRAQWRKLEAEGVAEDWVRGIGEGDSEKAEKQWVELMRRVIARAEYVEQK